MKRGHFPMLMLGAGLTFAGAAHAQDFDGLLRGTFSVTGTQTCLTSPGGFNANLTPIGPSFVTINSFLGTHIFNGDGTGSEDSSEVTVAFPPVNAGSSSNFSFTFTYDVSADRTVTAVNSTTSGHIVAGPLAGESYTVTFGSALGRLSLDGRSLTFFEPEPTVETVTFSNGEVQQRICSRSRILIKVENDTDHDAPGQR